MEQLKSKESKPLCFTAKHSSKKFTDLWNQPVPKPAQGGQES